MRLPQVLAELVYRTVGDFTIIADRSWPRDNSVVWEIADSRDRRWYVKQHPTPLFHEREATAYQKWTAALGPQRAPMLRTADKQAQAIVVSGLPGRIIKALNLTAADEQEIYRQLGELMRCLHLAAPPKDDHQAGTGVRRVIERVEEHLRRASKLVDPSDAGLVRRHAAQLADIAPLLPSVPSHGYLQPRNVLWDGARRIVALIDFERAEFAPAVRDLVRLEYGPWDGRTDLREAFFSGYGRRLSEAEKQALTCYAAIDAISGLQRGTRHGDQHLVARAHRTLARLAERQRYRCANVPRPISGG
jgi:Ser/Thr protein kinase RdoA (MazF antagonist)